MITNSLAIKNNPELPTILAKFGIKYVGISYHFNTHQNISSIDISVIHSAIHTLKQAGIIVDIRTTIDTRNFNKVKQMCEAAVALGVDGIKFTNLMNTEKVLTWNENYALSAAEIEQFLNEVEIQRKLF